MKQLFTALLFFATADSVFAQANEMQETIAIIKQNLADSKEKIKKYEWIETTTTFVKGEEKSKKQNQCYYGVDGKLVKVETGGSSHAKTKGGIRGKVIANKKEEMADYIEAAIKKIQTYLPPEAEKLQKIYGEGKTAIHVLEPGKKFKLDFPDYNLPGDMLSVSIDKEKKMILAMAVNTYIDKASEKVVFNITYNTLPDGTQYAGKTSLDASAKNVKIVIENSGYKKGAGQ
jgi:hypothetical protein